jgi:transposase InsO family protein
MEELNEFDYKVVHLPGFENVIPDVLSRIPNWNTWYKSSHDHEKETDLEFVFALNNDDERIRVLECEHELGHSNAKIMIETLQQLGYTWPDMLRHAQEVVNRCQVCQEYNTRKVSYHPLSLIKAELPMDHVAIDLAGPFPWTKGGFHYIVVMVDVFTRFVFIRGIMENTSRCVVRELIPIWMEFGFPKIIQTDNGSEFINSLMKELTILAGIDHRVISEYHPRANGLAERYVGIVKAVIVKSIKGDIRNFWKYRLNTIQFYLNRRVVHVHGTSPFTVMFGRRMNPFVNFQESQVLNEEEIHSKGKTRMEFLTNVLFPRVTKEINLLRKQDKRRFDEYSRLNQFPINSLVMITNTSKRSKLEPRFVGPYRIVRCQHDGSYLLMDGRNNLLPQSFAPSQLKLIGITQKILPPLDAIEQVLAVRGVGATRQLLLKWKDRTDPTWEMFSEYQDSDKVKSFVVKWNEQQRQLNQVKS